MLFSRINMIISRCYVDGRVGVCAMCFVYLPSTLFPFTFILCVVLAFFAFFFAMSLFCVIFLLLFVLDFVCSACFASVDICSSLLRALFCCCCFPAFSFAVATEEDEDDCLLTAVCSWIDDRAEEKPESRGDFSADGGGAGGKTIEPRAGVRLCDVRVEGDDAEDWLFFVALDVFAEINYYLFLLLSYVLLLLPYLLAELLLSYYDFTLFRAGVTLSSLSALTKWTDFRFLLAVCDWRELRLRLREDRTGVRELRVRVLCALIFTFTLPSSSYSLSLYALFAKNWSVDYEWKCLLGDVYDANRCNELRRRENKDELETCSLLYFVASLPSCGGTGVGNGEVVKDYIAIFYIVNYFFYY